MTGQFTIDDARALLAAEPFAQWWGLRAMELGDGTATVLLPAGHHLMRPGNRLHGACYEVVADVAMWLSIMTRTGLEPMAVTIEMKTNFLSGASSDLTAVARLMKLGRRIAFGTATMTDAGGRVVAYSTLTYARPTPG